MPVPNPRYRYHVRASFGRHQGLLARSLSLVEARAYVRHYIAEGLAVVAEGGPLLLVNCADGALSYDGGKTWEPCSAALRGSVELLSRRPVDGQGAAA